MFGITFLFHTKLRRILTDYGFKGHPLCKDFPLTGYLDLFYNDSLQAICYTPLNCLKTCVFINLKSHEIYFKYLCLMRNFLPKLRI